MVLGMTLETYTKLHVVISLIVPPQDFAEGTRRLLAHFA